MGKDLMVIELTRFAETPFGTFGLLVHGPMLLYTCEPQWFDSNQPVSCIPADVYRLSLIQTEKHGSAWVLLDVASRDPILIRVGNRQIDTDGDILIGKALGALGNEWALRDSAEALGLFHTYMGGLGEAMLNISWRDNPEQAGKSVSDAVLKDDPSLNLDGQTPE